MKRTILTGLLAITAISSQAQVVADSVSTGAGYTNQVWYSLSNDEQGSSPKNNWDIAFEASGFGSTILINSINGIMLWNYPHADTSGWGTVDTTGLSTWAARWNSDTTWAQGAMGKYADPANSFDLDWGIYNMTTHIITGDSLYIIKLADGNYKKLWIRNLASGTYSFRYANLDGTDLQNATLSKSAYSGKNFGYYSLQTNTALDREPISSAWDLLFTQHTAFIPSAYTVTGVIANAGVEVAKLAARPNKDTYTDYGSATFSTAINTIGYNWKTFSGSSFVVQDSLLFFVKPVNGDIWKVIFTGFGGSASGKYYFTKEKLYTNTSAVNDNATAATASLVLYPNPANGQGVTVVYSVPVAAMQATMLITDMTGRLLVAKDLSAGAGLQQYRILPGTIPVGVYVVSIIAAGNTTQQRLIIN